MPTNHRTDASQCATTPPPGSCSNGSSGSSGGPSGQCSSDSQCTSGKDGRCSYAMGGVPFCDCTYDTCTTDADCGAGKTCGCHGSAYLYGQGNTCVPGNCRVDADCGPGGYCSPAFSPNSCGSLGGYYCHTPKDQCVNDTDCGSTGTGPQACSYSTTAGRWECVTMPLCG